MILVTVGSQTPFDRLVRAMDDWARDRGRNDVFAQLGSTDWTPSHIRWERFLEPQRFQDLMAQSELIVSHAGMGSIIGALELRKPIIVMPRRADLRETRNDHQLATARRFSEMGYLRVAFAAEDLARQLDEILAEGVEERSALESPNQARLVCALREFLENAARDLEPGDETARPAAAGKPRPEEAPQPQRARPERVHETTT